jgi:HlyD family secretion protein
VNDQARASNKQDELEKLLGTERAARRISPLWLIAAAVALVLLAAVAYLLLGDRGGAGAAHYVTAPVTRGELVVRVSATGNLQPLNQVEVGSELSGTIQTVLVDDNDQVKRGQMLARLDVSKLNDAIAKSRAALTAAEARVLQSAATVREADANLQRLREVAKLSGGKVPSQAELETAEATLERARADVASAKAAVTEARAQLSSDETNLAKASIRSPIDGVVLSRKVEPGQTVAASLQAPVLFVLAEDLAEMELQVDVDEADVGQVRTGQPANFKVDAYPDRQYPATISRVDYGSQLKSGVVSYLTVLRVRNADLSLRPGMTATAEITTARRENALLVPDAALRFAPPAAPAQAGPSRGLVAMLLPRPPQPTQPKKAADRRKSGARQVWVLREGVPVEVPVVAGLSDGRNTEITGGEIEPGVQVITEMIRVAK